MVLEAHAGGWGKEARQVLDGLAKAIAATQPNSAESASLRIAQRLSITLQRENARAVLKRLAEHTHEDGDVVGLIEEPQAEHLW